MAVDAFFKDVEALAAASASTPAKWK